MSPREKQHSLSWCVDAVAWAVRHPKITTYGQWWWLGTFKSLKLDACTYDAVVWRFRRLCSELNLPDVESRQEAEFLGLEFWIVTREEVRENYRYTCSCVPTNPMRRPWQGFAL
jgi:hypothetical protein